MAAIWTAERAYTVMRYKTKTDPVHRFYGTQKWKKCRAAYWAKVHGLCEKCLAKGIITAASEVHHKIPLTPELLDRPELTTGFDNLMALCERCHEEEHQKFTHGGRYTIDEEGNVKLL